MSEDALIFDAMQVIYKRLSVPNVYWPTGFQHATGYDLRSQFAQLVKRPDDDKTVVHIVRRALNAAKRYGWIMRNSEGFYYIPVERGKLVWKMIPVQEVQ